MSELVWNIFAGIGIAQTVVMTTVAIGIAAVILKPDRRQPNAE